MELFEIDNIEMQTTTDAVGFLIINSDEGEIKNGIDSPWLSRELLKNSPSKEVAGAIIDFILHRNKWSHKNSYQRIYL